MNTQSPLFHSSIRASSMNEIQIKEEEIFFDYEKDTITEEYSLEEPKEIKATDTSALKLYSASKKISKEISKEISNEMSKEISKKISKKILKKKSKKVSKKISNEKPIERQNAERFVKFFEKWKNLKKTDANVKEQTKFWFSSFDKNLNKTYIYRNFDKSRIHFRLAINEKSLDFDKLAESEWPILFRNLTNYLLDHQSSISTEKKSIVVNVWIDGLDTFRIDEKSARSKEPALQDSNLEKEHNNEIDAESPLSITKEPKKQKKSKAPKENRAVEVNKKSSLLRKIYLPDDKKDSEDSTGISGKLSSSMLVKKTRSEEKYTRVDETIAESAKKHLKKTPSSHYKKIDHSEKLREDLAETMLENKKTFEREGDQNPFREIPISSSSSDEDDDKASATSVKLEEISAELEFFRNSIQKKFCRLKEVKNQSQERIVRQLESKIQQNVADERKRCFEMFRIEKESLQKELREARKEIQVLNREILVHIPGDSTQIKNAWVLAARDKVTNYDKTMQLLHQEKVEIQEQDLFQSISRLVTDLHSSERRNEETLQQLEQTVTKLKKIKKN